MQTFWETSRTVIGNTRKQVCNISGTYIRCFDRSQTRPKICIPQNDPQLWCSHLLFEHIHELLNWYLNALISTTSLYCACLLQRNPRQWKSSPRQLAIFYFLLSSTLYLWFCLASSSTTAATSTCFRWTLSSPPAGPWSCVQVYLHLLQEHGLGFGIHQAYLLDYLFCTIAVACAFDFTFQFDWVLDREEWAKSITFATNVSTI